MHLVVQSSGKYKYVSFRESFWDPERKKYSSRTVKNFGRLDILQEKNPNILNELQAQAENYKEQHQQQKKKAVQQRVSTQVIQDVDTTSTADNPVFQLGPCIYRQIWNKLNLQRKLRDWKTETQCSFDLPGAIFFLTTARSLKPDSKLGQWQQRKEFFYGGSKLPLHQLYRALDQLIARKEDFIRYINRQIARQYQRTVSVALYDVTTYYFESQDADTLRAFGFSKDNKVNQVQVVMGLLIDDQGIPVDYELFPGNTCEFKTMVPLLERLKTRYGIERVIVTADRGLNSGANLLAIKEMGLEYVMAYRLRSASTEIIEQVLSANNWTTRCCGSQREDVSRYRITTDNRIIRRRDPQGKWESIPLQSQLLINYSARRARKDAADRDRLVAKAQRLADSPALLRSEMHRGGKSYLQVKDGALTATVDKETIQRSERLDGYYGIVYSDPKLTPEEVLNIHHSLWQIEESFRISKSLLEARPCFHWKSERIQAHFLICYLALVMHRLLERELQLRGIQGSAEEIVAALRRAHLLEIEISPSEKVYCKSGTEGLFEEIASAVGLGKLPRIATLLDLKKTLKLRVL